MIKTLAEVQRQGQNCISDRQLIGLGVTGVEGVGIDVTLLSLVESSCGYCGVYLEIVEDEGFVGYSFHLGFELSER